MEHADTTTNEAAKETAETKPRTIGSLRVVDLPAKAVKAPGKDRTDLPKLGLGVRG
jgi:hypothetical protein